MYSLQIDLSFEPVRSVLSVLNRILEIEHLIPNPKQEERAFTWNCSKRSIRLENQPILLAAFKGRLSSDDGQAGAAPTIGNTPTVCPCKPFWATIATTATIV